MAEVQTPVRCCWGEVAPQQIRCCRQVMPGVGSELGTALVVRLDAILWQQPLHPPLCSLGNPWPAILWPGRGLPYTPLNSTWIACISVSLCASVSRLGPGLPPRFLCPLAACASQGGYAGRLIPDIEHGSSNRSSKYNSNLGTGLPQVLRTPAAGHKRPGINRTLYYTEANTLAGKESPCLW